MSLRSFCRSIIQICAVQALYFSRHQVQHSPPHSPIFSPFQLLIMSDYYEITIVIVFEIILSFLTFLSLEKYFFRLLTSVDTEKNSVAMRGTQNYHDSYSTIIIIISFLFQLKNMTLMTLLIVAVCRTRIIYELRNGPCSP